MTTQPEQNRASLYLADTHEIQNISREFQDVNLYTTDTALQAAVHREGGGWADAELTQFGALTGSADYLELGHLANKFGPEFDTHDRFGNRIDRVKYHPAYHTLMQTSIENGLHASPWSDPKPGAHGYLANLDLESGLTLTCDAPRA